MFLNTPTTGSFHDAELRGWEEEVYGSITTDSPVLKKIE